MKKKKIRLKRWVKVALLSLIFCFMASFVNIRHQNNDKIVVQNDQKVAENIEEMAQNIENTAENEEKIEQIEEPHIILMNLAIAQVLVNVHNILRSTIKDGICMTGKLYWLLLLYTYRKVMERLVDVIILNIMMR